MPQTWLFVFLLRLVIVPASYIERRPGDDNQLTDTASEGRPCQDQELHNRTVLGGLMVKSGVLSEKDLRLHHLPNITFLQFSFLSPVLIRGWTLKGRAGEMFGPVTKRRGYVASYVVTYVKPTRGGGAGGGRGGEGGGRQRAEEVEILNDPETDEEEFVSDGNLARPETLTDVELKEVLETQTLRMAPVVWSGVPYMSVKLFFCANKQDLTLEERKILRQEDVDENLSVTEMKGELKHSRTLGTLAAALDATKSAMGIKTPKTEDEIFVQKPTHLPYTFCLHPPTWRYATKPTPVDSFLARGNPQQAWRAILGLAYTPYLFPTEGPRSHEHQLLEILFQNRSHVTAVKVAGLGEAGADKGRWGAVTKFSLLYKNPKTDKWVYYSDAAGTPRVFTVGNRSRSTGQKVGVFHLPVPLSTDALGFFPHEWANKPYLALDLLACYMRGKPEEEGVSNTTTFTDGHRTMKTSKEIQREGGERGQENSGSKEKDEVRGENSGSKEKDEVRGEKEVKHQAQGDQGDSKSEETEVTEETETKPSEVPEPISVEKTADDTTDEESDDVEDVADGSTEDQEAEDMQTALSGEQKEAEAVLNHEEKDVKDLVSEIQKDVENTVASTQLQRKRLRAPKKPHQQRSKMHHRRKTPRNGWRKMQESERVDNQRALNEAAAMEQSMAKLGEELAGSRETKEPGAEGEESEGTSIAVKTSRAETSPGTTQGRRRTGKAGKGRRRGRRKKGHRRKSAEGEESEGTSIAVKTSRAETSPGTTQGRRRSGKAGKGRRRGRKKKGHRRKSAEGEESEGTSIAVKTSRAETSPGTTQGRRRSGKAGKGRRRGRKKKGHRRKKEEGVSNTTTFTDGHRTMKTSKEIQREGGERGQENSGSKEKDEVRGENSGSKEKDEVRGEKEVKHQAQGDQGDSKSEETEVTEETETKPSEVPEPISVEKTADDTTDEESDDVEDVADGSTEDQEAEDMQTALSGEQKEAEAVLNHEEKDVKDLVSEIRKDVENTVASTQLQRKRLRAPKKPHQQRSKTHHRRKTPRNGWRKMQESERVDNQRALNEAAAMEQSMAKLGEELAGSRETKEPGAEGEEREVTSIAVKTSRAETSPGTTQGRRRTGKAGKGRRRGRRKKGHRRKSKG